MERLRQKHAAELEVLVAEHNRVADGFEVILQREVAAAQQVCCPLVASICLSLARASESQSVRVSESVRVRESQRAKESVRE